MGRIAEVLRTERTIDESGHGLDVVSDPGGGANVTAPHFASPGVDSVPLPGDFAALEDSTGVGEEHCAGYADVANAGTAGPGEIRLYARNASGAPVSEVWLKADGTVVITATGDVTINGVTISPAGAISAPGEVTAKSGTPAAVGLSTHLHGTGIGPTSAPTPGT